MTQEIIGMRTRNSKTIDNGDGTRTLNLRKCGLHYLKDGRYEDIDTTIVNGSMSKAGYNFDVNGNKVKFSKDGDWIEFEIDKLQWSCETGQALVSEFKTDVIPVVTGNEIRWDDAFGKGIHLLYGCGPDGIYKKVILDDYIKPPAHLINEENLLLEIVLKYKKSNIHVRLNGAPETFEIYKYVREERVVFGDNKFEFVLPHYWDSGIDFNVGHRIITKNTIRTGVMHSWLIKAIFPVYIDTDVNEQVGVSSDDATENNLGQLYPSSNNVYIRLAGGTHQDACFRWTTVAVPKDATINSATLSLYLDNDRGGLISTIKGIDEDNTATWSSGSKPSQRTKTTATVQANQADWGNWGEDNWITRDISTIISEITSRDNWASNNALAVVIEENCAAEDGVWIRAWDYDTHTLGAKLDISYTVPITKTFSIDAILEATQTKTFTIDGLLEDIFEKTFTVDGYLVDRLTKEFSIDSILEATQTKTFSIDAKVVSPSVDKIFTIDGYLVDRLDKEFTVDSYLVNRLTKEFTVDSYLVSRLTKEFSIDAILEATETKDFSTDGILEATQSKDFSIDSILEATEIKTFSVDGILEESGTKTFTIDALLEATFSKDFSIDGYLVATYIKEFSIDSILKAVETKDFSINAILEATQSKEFTVDGLLEKVGSKEFSIDAVIKAIETKEFSIDGILEATYSKEFNTDGYLVDRLSKDFTLDSYLVSRLSKGFTLDTYLVDRLTKEFSIDVLLEVTHTKDFTVDGMLKSVLSKDFSTDGILEATFSKEFSIDGALVRTWFNEFSIDAALVRTSTKEFTVDAVIGRSIKYYIEVLGSEPLHALTLSEEELYDITVL